MRVQWLAAIGGLLLTAACSSPAPATHESTMPMANGSGTPSSSAMPMTDHHPATGQDEVIARALSAGPSDITAHAAVVDMSASGEMKELRAGTNGWVCMAHPEVMCVDKEWQAFMDAYVHKSDPHVTTVGIGYMLRGDQGASNTDPFAEKATADNQWVVSPPHVMILTPNTAQLDALPTDFRTGGPWVMWKGTKYAHVMVPTTAMHSGMAESK